MESNIGIGVYKKEDYKEILKISVDKEKMNQTWNEWKKTKNRTVANFQKLGIKTVDILVKPKELVQFCRENGLEINGQARANFISNKVGLLNKK